MRTIIVVFTDRKVSLNEVSSYKKYKFLCNYDTVSLYDKVNGQVINQPAGLVNGSLAGSDFDIDRQRNNNMENWQVNKVFYYEVIRVLLGALRYYSYRVI